MQAENQINDSVKAVMQDEYDMCKFVVGESRKSYEKCLQAESKSTAQLQHKDVQIEAKESENAGLRKELKKQKRKSFWTSVATAGSLALNVILGIKLASK